MRKFLFATLVLATVHAAPAFGWSAEGHRIVCRIAYSLLDQQDRNELDRLMKAYTPPHLQQPYGDFSEGCVFADIARTNSKGTNVAKKWKYFRQFKKWHFLNVPRDTKTIEATDCADNCVLRGIRQHAAAAKDTARPDWQRGQALLLLGHWVGDVHQPLHISYEDDTGGNDINDIRGNFYDADHLHGVWDGGIIFTARRAEGETWKEYADRLKNTLPNDVAPWLQSDELAWAQESYDITIGPETDYCELEIDQDGNELCAWEGPTRTLKSAYQTRFRPAVERRLQQAGVRLAAKLRDAL